jgi:hypothetical protein
MRTFQLLTLALLATAANADTGYLPCTSGSVAQIANTSCTIGNALFTFGPAQTENYLNDDPAQTFSGTIVDPVVGGLVTAIATDSIAFTPEAIDPLHPGFSLGDFRLFGLSPITSHIGLITERLDWTITSIQLLDNSKQIAGLSAGIGFLNLDTACIFIGLGDMQPGEQCGLVYAPYSNSVELAPSTALSGVGVKYGGATEDGGGFIANDLNYHLDEIPEPMSLILLGTVFVAALSLRGRKGIVREARAGD